MHALLTGQDGLLGDPVAVWRELAAGPGGAEAASGFLGYLAFVTSMRLVTGPRWEPSRCGGPPPSPRVCHPGALAGAGDFAAALPDEVWLPLARRSAAHTPAQKDAGRVAARAAAHPGSSDALLLAAHLLTRPAPDGAYDGDVRRPARALLRAAEALPAPDRRPRPRSCAAPCSKPARWTSPVRRRRPAQRPGPGGRPGDDLRVAVSC